MFSSSPQQSTLQKIKLRIISVLKSCTVMKVACITCFLGFITLMILIYILIDPNLLVEDEEDPPNLVEQIVPSAASRFARTSDCQNRRGASHPESHYIDQEKFDEEQSRIFAAYFRTKSNPDPLYLDPEFYDYITNDKLHPVFQHDRPRYSDEGEFCHRGGNFIDAPPVDEFLSGLDIDGHYKISYHGLKEGEDIVSIGEMKQAVRDLYQLFKDYDIERKKRDEELQQTNSNNKNNNDKKQHRKYEGMLKESVEVYGTMCVGNDCFGIPHAFSNLRVGVGHFIVVVNTNERKWVRFFTDLESYFVGRFTKFHRPWKLSCSESWNTIARMGFSIRPMPEFLFIANADWYPKKIKIDDDPPLPFPDNHMKNFIDYNSKHMRHVLNGYSEFSSFALNRVAYFELGYFDEVIFPAWTEDFEFHLKAVSLGMGDLGIYKHFRKAAVHEHSTSGKNEKVKRRKSRNSAFHYLYLKWGVDVNHRGDKQIHMNEQNPYKNPFNLPMIRHNNSWAVDHHHRKCLMTGKGKKFPNSGKCYYNPRVLKKAGLVPKGYPLPKGLLIEDDVFPGWGAFIKSTVYNLLL